MTAYWAVFEEHFLHYDVDTLPHHREWTMSIDRHTETTLRIHVKLSLCLSFVVCACLFYLCIIIIIEKEEEVLPPTVNIPTAVSAVLLHGSQATFRIYYLKDAYYKTTLFGVHTATVLRPRKRHRSVDIFTFDGARKSEGGTSSSE